MKTASFFTYQGPGRISIARRAPKGMSGFTIHRALASDRDMLRLLREEYLVRFEAILARLEPLEQWERLHHLAGDAEPVLLCWKRPPFTEANWCHRRMVAAWFEQELGVEVLEV